MKNILFLINHAGKGGTEKYIEILIDHLDKTKFTPFFAYNEEGELSKKIKEKGIKSFRIIMKSPFDLKAIRDLNSLCKKFNIKIIHTHFIRENYLALLTKLKNFKIKVIYTNHIVVKNSKLQIIGNRLMSLLQFKIIAVCNYGKKILIDNGFSETKVTVIFNAIDQNYWGKGTRSNLRTELNIDENMVVLVSTSRFSHEKGHDFLINSIYKLTEKGVTNFRLILINEGELLESIKNKVNSLRLNKYVRFIGHRSDIRNILYGCDIFINSSSYEAMSFAILEALGTGRVVIATKTPGTMDIINAENEMGILVDYGDEEPLSEILRGLICHKDKWHHYSDKAKIGIHEKFLIESMLNKTFELYK